MAAIAMKLEGAEVLMRRLEGLAPKLQKKAMRRGVRAGGKVIQAEAKSRAPVRTGRMRKAIVVRAQKRTRRQEVGINVMLDTKRFPSLIVTTAKGTRFFYPSIIEYGARGRAAHPFMRPAFDTAKGRAMKAIETTLKTEIEKAAKGPA